MNSQQYVKTAYQIKEQTDIINRNISRLTPVLIERIRSNAGLDNTFESSVFRPESDMAMLLFKKDRKSHYTINLFSLRPTSNSIIKKDIPNDVRDSIIFGV